jgi:hypothetical protein
MENIKDFEIQKDDKKMIIRYTGSNQKIDKCYSHLSANFVAYHLIEALQSINNTDEAPK